MAKLLDLSSFKVISRENIFWHKTISVMIQNSSLKVIPNSQIIFMNTGEYGVCNILIITTPFVIRMISHTSPSGIDLPRIPNILSNCVINTIRAIFINYSSVKVRHRMKRMTSQLMFNDLELLCVWERISPLMGLVE